MTGVFLSVPRYDRYAPLSHPSSCMLVNHGPSQQSCKDHVFYCCSSKMEGVMNFCMNIWVIYHPRGSLCQDPAGNRMTRRPPGHCKEMQTAVVWSCLLFIRSGQNHIARHSEREKNTRQTGEEVGRQHQGMDRSGVRQVQGAVENRENGGKWLRNHLWCSNDPPGEEMDEMMR